MLKFATKKPPRLKHSDQVKISAPMDNHGRVFIDDSSSYLTGNYTRFERINGDDMIDSDHQKVEYIRPAQNQGPEYLDIHNKENFRDQNRGWTVSPPNIHWKAYNVKYGKVGVENELDFSDTSPVRQVGMSRNDLGQRSGMQQVDQGQRSQQVNPGYIDNTLEHRRYYDMNRNYNNPEGTYNSRIYSKGSGYHFPSSGGHFDDTRSQDSERSRSHGYGHDYNGNPQHQGHSHRLQHENPFPAPSFSTDSNGMPYCADSTGSMSIDSMSTSGDRSSKSVSETPDYDMLLDLPQHTKHGLDLKPPVPHKPRHVHVGRGTHGVCEGSVSPNRPGSSESSMTSSLRKSPSGMKSQHHVRWGPGVVNSQGQQHDPMQRSSGQGQIQTQYYAQLPVTKKTKKKTSLRSLLNLPKFPTSDDESTDSTLDGQGSERTKKEYNRTSENVAHRGTLRKLLDYRPRKRATQMTVSQPVVTTELASLKYKRDYHHGDVAMATAENAEGQRPPLTKLNISEANRQYPLQFDYEYLEPTDSISYPIMHSGQDSSIFRNENLNEIKDRPDTINRSPVNSVRPFLINGQSSEIGDYDYYRDSESKPQTSEVISVNVNDKNEFNALHHDHVSQPHTYDLQSRTTTNVLQTTRPFTTATFDTYVTLGRPNESTVTFDTFVTHGRPYATSTPIPNGSIGTNTSNVNISQDYLTTGNKGTGDFSDPRRVNVHNSGYLGTSGQIGAIGSNVTQTWNYSVPGAQLSTVPLSTHSVWTRSMESAMHPGSHAGITSVARLPEGPYDLENRVYGKLSPPLSPYINSSSQMGVYVSQSANVGNNPNVLDLQGQRSQGQTMTERPTENIQFKDTCSYREKDTTGDYDDDVFLSLGLTPNIIGKSGTVRRKLDFTPDKNTKVSQSFAVYSVVVVTHEVRNANKQYLSQQAKLPPKHSYETAKSRGDVAGANGRKRESSDPVFCHENSKKKKTSMKEAQHVKSQERTKKKEETEAQHVKSQERTKKKEETEDRENTMKKKYIELMEGQQQKNQQIESLEKKIDGLTKTTMNLSSKIDQLMSCKSCLKKAYKTLPNAYSAISLQAGLGPLQPPPSAVFQQTVKEQPLSNEVSQLQQKPNALPETEATSQLGMVNSDVSTADSSDTDVVEDNWVFLGEPKYNVRVRKDKKLTILQTAKTAEKLALGLLELIITKSEVPNVTIYGNKQHNKAAMCPNKREALKAEVFKKFQSDSDHKSWDNIVVCLNDKIRNFRNGKYSLDKLQD